MTRTAMPMAQEAELPLTPAELDVCKLLCEMVDTLINICCLGAPPSLFLF